MRRHTAHVDGINEIRASRANASGLCLDVERGGGLCPSKLGMKL